jgi:hypothetical protein
LRWFFGGRPPSGEGRARKGSKIAHSSSLIRPRITANLQQRGQRRITRAPRRESASRQTTECESQPGRLDSFRQAAGRAQILSLPTVTPNGVCPQGLIKFSSL